MNITIEKDDGTQEVFNHCTDLYIAIRQTHPIMNKEQQLSLQPETRSYSWGGNIRALLCEIRQSAEELQEVLKSLSRQA